MDQLNVVLCPSSIVARAALKEILVFSRHLAAFPPSPKVCAMPREVSEKTNAMQVLGRISFTPATQSNGTR
jgi:hypothetical protein